MGGGFLVLSIWKALLLVLKSGMKRRLLYVKYEKYPPEAILGPFARSFWWLNPLLWNGYKGVLDSLDCIFAFVLTHPHLEH